MGNNYSDLNTMMSMSVEKPMYIAGQMVDGNTRMVIRTHLPYDHLVLKLECYEYCQWKRHANTRIIDNSLKYPDYEGHNRLFYQVYNLAEFPGGVKKGFYVFPFSVRIPSDLPGSLITGFASITYVLSTYLAHSGDLNLFRPSCSCVVNVTEPVRFPLSNTMYSQTVEPKSCYCCSQGSTRMDVNFTNNIANAGEPLHVNIVTDNSGCAKNVMKTRMELISTAFLQSDTGTHQELRSVISQKIVSGKVLAHTSSQLSANLEVPKNLANSTAIGHNVAYYYTLELSNELSSSCCSTKEGPSLKQHIYLRAIKPIIDNRAKEATLPPDWDPVVAAKRVFSEPGLGGMAANPLIKAMNRPYPGLPAN